MKSQHTTIAPRQFVSAALGAVALTVVLATATLAPTFVGVASASIQAVRVSYSHFPTVAEVAEHYPHLDGGTREMFGNAQVFVPSTGSCSGLWEFARHQPRIGKFMVYEPARVATAGRDDPQVLLRGFWYRTPRAAATAFGEIRRSIRRCFGRHFHNGEGVALHRLPMPRIGAQSFAYRYVGTNPKGSGRTWAIGTYVRRGPTIVNVDVSKTTRAPAARPAIALTRAALRAID
jgi:hypothetical protein